MVLRPDREDVARKIFEKWELDFAVIGHLTDTGRIVVRHRGVIEADIPLAPLNDQAPLYHRPTAETPKQPTLNPARIEDRLGLAAGSAEADRLPRPVLARLDLGPVRQHRRRQDREAPRRRRRRRGEARRPRPRAGADHRLHPALLRRRPGSRRRAGGRRGLAQPHRGRRPPAGADRQHEFRQSGKARDHGPVRRRHPRHGRRLRGAGLPGRVRQRQRSTTRPRAAASCPPRRSAASACWRMPPPRSASPCRPGSTSC